MCDWRSLTHSPPYPPRTLTPPPLCSVITPMTTQRESLLRATDSASNTNSLALTARGLLMQMTARALTNKLLLAFTVLILLAANGVLVYFIFKDGSGKKR